VSETTLSAEVEAALTRLVLSTEMERVWEKLYPEEAWDDDYYAGCERLDKEAEATLRTALERSARIEAAAKVYVDTHPCPPENRISGGSCAHEDRLRAALNDREDG
jgi:hypothetical protein